MTTSEQRYKCTELPSHASGIFSMATRGLYFIYLHTETFRWFHVGMREMRTPEVIKRNNEQFTQQRHITTDTIQIKNGARYVVIPVVFIAITPNLVDRGGHLSRTSSTLHRRQ